jgi:phosphatidylcholine synthase
MGFYEKKPACFKRGTDLKAMQSPVLITWQTKCLGWLIHIFTASGAFVGLMALLSIYQHNWLASFWWMGAAILIDAVDGVFARVVKIKMVVPQIDGALLDNIVDFFNYTIVPCFFLLVTPTLPLNWCLICVMAITLSSAYQFTQLDAKTSDHFFKGFPSYWNIVVFYLYFWQMNVWINLVILLALAVLSFVPIKYVYPSRLDYLTHNKILRICMLLATILWGAATAGLLWCYPESNPVLTLISMGYLILYVGMSFYRTWVPLDHPLHD